MRIGRDLAVLGGRLVLGGYLAAHGAQKLFGAFDGPGLGPVSKGFEHIGLRPGKVMAAAAGVSELGGGLLTATGLLNPLGPLALTGTMAVASTTHRANGPFAQKGGYELALTNLAGALVLASTGPGRFSMDSLLGVKVPTRTRWLAVLFGLVSALGSITMMLRATPPPDAAQPPEASSVQADPEQPQD
jgi:putative oxidoreductase